MSTEPASSTKVCIICHQDCSNRPRQKDGQGRYVCQDCLNKAKQQGAKEKMAAPAAKAPPRSEAPIDPGLAAALADVDQGAMEPCPNCAVLLKPGAVLCTSCGFDIEKGKAVRTRVQELSARERKAAAAPEKQKRSAGAGFNVEPSTVLVLVLIAVVGVAAWAYSDPSVMLLMYIAGGIMFYATMITMIVGAFKDEDGVWGILGIVALVTGFTGILTLYYIFAKSDRAMVKILAIATIVTFGLLFIVAFSHADRAIREGKPPPAAGSVEPDDTGEDDAPPAPAGEPPPLT